MGTVWLIAGLAGLSLLLKRQPAFSASVIVLLILSQAPRLGIDIPPVRALLYAVTPLSITAAYLFIALLQRFKQPLLRAAILAFLIIPAIASTSQAFQLSHAPRTNSTLTPGQLELVQYLSTQEGNGILIDDYNRRSASWLVLSEHPMFTRIAADLERQMLEARQSDQRYQLYLKQLDFEKIFALGSLPAITELMQKHNITWLTGITGSSNSSFEHNPNLTATQAAGDITLYKLAGDETAVEVSEQPSKISERSREDFDDVARGARINNVQSREAGRTTQENRSQNLTRLEASDERIQWLLRPSTLANDIGDNEDTFEHLQASIRSTRLSDPKTTSITTYRTTKAPIISLKFNVGNYTRILWDQENTGFPDTTVELYIKLNTPTELTIQTPVLTKYQLPNTGNLRIPAPEVPYDKDGFIEITILNPNESVIDFDLIALGLARTP